MSNWRGELRNADLNGDHAERAGSLRFGGEIFHRTIQRFGVVDGHDGEPVRGTRPGEEQILPLPRNRRFRSAFRRLISARAPVEVRTENISRIVETSAVLGRFPSDNAKPN